MRIIGSQQTNIPQNARGAVRTQCVTIPRAVRLSFGTKRLPARAKYRSADEETFVAIRLA